MVPMSFHPKALLAINNSMLIFEKLTNYKEHSTNKKMAEIDSWISENFTLEVVFER